MKAIETKYNGVTFRSRMEARWAVFMDALGMKWDYEPEAYELDGLSYLPDFWLPEQKVFFEVKPAEPTNEEREKAARLADFTKHHVIIQSGNPHLPVFGDNSETPICIFGKDGEDYPYWWCECPTCHKVDFQYTGRSERIKCRCAKKDGRDYNHDTPRLKRAYEIAKGHTFWVPPAR